MGQTFSEVDMGCLVQRSIGMFKVSDQGPDRLLTGSDQVDGFHSGQRFAVLVDVLNNWKAEFVIKYCFCLSMISVTHE